MESAERSREIVVRVIDQMNRDFPEEPTIEKSPTTILSGPGGRLDSLGLVDLVFRIQETVRDEYGIAIAVADENVLSSTESPFRTVESLIAHLDQLLAS
jgi:acyl carrier protein